MRIPSNIGRLPPPVKGTGGGVGATPSGEPVRVSLPGYLYQPPAAVRADFDDRASVVVGLNVNWNTALTFQTREGTSLVLREWGWSEAGAAPPAREELFFRIVTNGRPHPGYGELRGDELGTISGLSGALVNVGQWHVVEVQYRDTVLAAGRGIELRAAGWQSPSWVGGGL